MTTIVSLLDQAAATYGSRQALAVTRGIRPERWSYSALREFSLKVATYLARRNVRPGDFVVVWAPNSPEWVALFFGCLRAGAVLVPLDLRCSFDFASKIACRVKPRLIIASKALGESAKRLAPDAILIEDLPGLAGEAGYPAVEHELRPWDMAELMFTSGTTGEPKGVVLTHGNIVANVRAAALAVPPRPEYRLLSLLPLSHMLEQTVGLLAPLSGGASIVYPASRQPAVIFKALREERITTVAVVPEVLRLFWDAIDREVQKRGKGRTFERLRAGAVHLPMRARRALFHSLHRRLGGRLGFFMVGGAHLDPELARKWESIGIYVLQGYGTTEASPVVTTNTFRDRKFDSVGRVLQGQELRIAADGEVQIRGRNVTSGYWRDAATTEAAFEGDWYRTGDLGNIDADGHLHLHGRKKDMIVLENGMNVYAQDVENALKSHPDVADAAVLGIPDGAGRTQVHAAVLLRPAVADASAAVECANTRLAGHQKVRSFTVWPFEDFPRTHTLKVRKQEVAAYVVGHVLPPRSTPATNAPTAAPNHLAKPGLVAVVASIAAVGASEVHPDDQLEGDLGLDSLKRVELLSAIEADLGVYLDESTVGPDTTVETLGQLLDTATAPVEPRFPAWPTHPIARAARSFVQSTALRPLVRTIARIEPEGDSVLACLSEPVLIAANHQSHLDTAVVLACLPARLRRRVAVAAAADYWFEAGRLRRLVAGFAFNGFPFSRTTAVRPTLRHCGRLVDKGWSILIYPEGTRSTDGSVADFKPGTGLMAIELGVPVVPVYIAGTASILPKGQAVPRPGPVTVRIGEPLRISRGTSPVDATRRIREAIDALATRTGRSVIERPAGRVDPSAGQVERPAGS
ncbi:MAG: AMP-binding protein [Chloroflexi bacterium]|nr:AMP-binding protein [Chloroflexota bacterium]